jgi:periplasmic divalent cation tolerance protein
VTGTRVVLMTAPDRDTAEAVARSVVTERLAACANLVPGIHSLFWWEGEVRSADEVLVVMKTPAERVAALIARAAELHPYDTPELVALPVEAELASYGAWVRREAGLTPEADG